jgi:hypothetical protein
MEKVKDDVRVFRRKKATWGWSSAGDARGRIASHSGCQHVPKTLTPSRSESECLGTSLPHQGSWMRRMLAFDVFRSVDRADC